MEKFSKKDQKTLNNISKITKVFQDEIQKLSQQELEDVISVGQRLSESNCYWATYWLKPVILKFATERLRDMVLETNPS